MQVPSNPHYGIEGERMSSVTRCDAGRCSTGERERQQRAWAARDGVGRGREPRSAYGAHGGARRG